MTTQAAAVTAVLSWFGVVAAVILFLVVPHPTGYEAVLILSWGAAVGLPATTLSIRSRRACDAETARMLAARQRDRLLIALKDFPGR